MKYIKFLTLIAGLLIVNPFFSLAQKKTLDIDGGLYFSSSNIACHFSVNYNRLFNPNFGASAGAMFLSAPLNVAAWSNVEKTSCYYLDNNNVQHVNVVLSAFYIRPLMYNMGIYGNYSILFEPIPYEYISIDKRTNNDLNQVPEHIGGFQYSGFSPGTFADAGFFRNFVKDDKGFRLFIGFGYGWYDMYAAYRRATINGQSLSTRIPGDNYYKRITIKLMGI